MSKRSLIFLTALTVLLAALPYVYAAQRGGGDFVFNGFLLNPLDGNSYLAKMREGWQGSWQFSMLYSSQAPQGSYLFLLYIALGHLARWLGLPLLLVFHGARIAGAIALCLALYRFIETYLADHSDAPELLHLSSCVWAPVLAGWQPCLADLQLTFG